MHVLYIPYTTLYWNFFTGTIGRDFQLQVFQDLLFFSCLRENVKNIEIALRYSSNRTRRGFFWKNRGWQSRETVLLTITVMLYVPTCFKGVFSNVCLVGFFTIFQLVCSHKSHFTCSSKIKFLFPYMYVKVHNFDWIFWNVLSKNKNVCNLCSQFETPPKIIKRTYAIQSLPLLLPTRAK